MFWYLIYTIVILYCIVRNNYDTDNNIDIDECEGDPCINADCENINGSYICRCMHRFMESNQTDPTAPCGKLKT